MFKKFLTSDLKWCIPLLVIWIAFSKGIDLGADEAHYILYGMYPDWSYFDHPPLIGWVQSLMIHLLGINEWSARIPALIAFLWTFYELKKSYRITLSELLPLVTNLIPFGLSVLFLPDTLLLPLALCSLRLLKNVFQKSISFVLLTGITIGLCGLTKYSAILLAPGFLIAFLESYYKQQSQSSSRIAPLIKRITLITASAFLTLSPLVLWNVQNDWISLKYQYLHLHGEHNLSLMKFVQSFMIQWLGFGLLVVPSIIFVTIRQIRVVFALIKTKTLPARRTWNQPYFWTALFFSAYFIHRSFYTVTLPHWTLVAWYFWWVLVHQKINQQLKKIQVTINFAILIGFVCLIWIPINLNHLINLREVKGWPQLMQHLDQTINPRLNIFISNWSYGSRALFYAPSSAKERVFVLDNRYDQFDLWERPKKRAKVAPGYLLQFVGDTINWHELPVTCEQSTEIHEVSDPFYGKWKHRFYLHFCRPQ